MFRALSSGLSKRVSLLCWKSCRTLVTLLSEARPDLWGFQRAVLQNIKNLSSTKVPVGKQKWYSLGNKCWEPRNFGHLSIAEGWLRWPRSYSALGTPLGGAVGFGWLGEGHLVPLSSFSPTARHVVVWCKGQGPGSWPPFLLSSCWEEVSPWFNVLGVLGPKNRYLKLGKCWQVCKRA